MTKTTRKSRDLVFDSSSYRQTYHATPLMDTDKATIVMKGSVLFSSA